MTAPGEPSLDNPAQEGQASGLSGCPFGLLTDLLAEPGLARIATTRPTFGWVVPGSSQMAYRLIVRNFLGEVLWDTGRIESGRSLHIPYEGVPLAWGDKGDWRVCVWTAEGICGGWSELQNFLLADDPPEEPVSSYPLEVAEILPSEVVLLSNGGVFFDFGRHSFGWLEIEAEVAAPVAVTVRLGEKLKDGCMDREPGGTIRFAEAEFSLAPGTRRHRVPLAPDLRNTRPTWDGDTPPAILLPPELGVVMPFRFAEAEGLPEAATVRMARVQYRFDEAAAAFRCSDRRLDDVWELCRHSMLATSFAGYYVDGDRERIPYEADAYINQLSHYAVDREFSLARRTHEYLLKYPTWPTEWKQHSILIAWADYEATGDTRSLERCYEVLKEEKLLLAHARPDGLLDTGAMRDIVDWPPDERDGFVFGPVNAVINAFHYRTLVLMGRIAEALGRSRDAADFQERGARVAVRFNEVFFDSGRGVYVDSEGTDHASLHANLFPLAFDLVPREKMRPVAGFIKGRGMACSVYAAQYLLEGLFKAGEGTYAMELMVSSGLRSWHNMLAKGATITWEAWDQDFKPNQDWNHAWGAAPANIVARFVLGVRPVEAGYGAVSIEPCLGGLDWAEGTVPTIRGPIQVRAWKGSNGEVLSQIRLPGNVRRVCDLAERPPVEPG
jgi:hypothetical protein